MRLARDFRTLCNLGPQGLSTLAQAIVELAIARVRLARKDLKSLLSEPVHVQLGQSDPDLIDHVSYFIPRVASRLPWRSDCLIQALAAQRWLRRYGIDSRINFGARPGGTRSLDAHAWLTIGTRVITGGEIVDFEPFEKVSG